MMNRIQRAKRRELASTKRRGSALVVSMVFVLIVAGMGVCMVQMHTSQNRRQQVSVDRKRAIYIAEAGLAEAFMCVAQGRSGTLASAAQPASFGGGVYWVESEAMPGGQVSLTSTGGTLSMGSGVVVTGATSPKGSDFDLPAIEVPDLPNQTLLGGLLGALLPDLLGGQYEFEKVTVGAGKTFQVKGPTEVVFEQLILAEGGTLQVDSTDGQVTIYVTERLKFAPGSIVDNLQSDPQGLVLMVAADEWVDFNRDGIADNPVEFEPEGDFFGYIYAPTVDFELSADTRFFGGVAANSVTIAPGSRLTFDLSLSNSDIAISGLPLLVAWCVCDIPDEPICRSNKDPMAFLSDLAVVPLDSATASTEQFVKLSYFKADGTISSYSGPASGIVWGSVRQVIEILWDDDAVADADDGQRAYLPLIFSAKRTLTRATSGK